MLFQSRLYKVLLPKTGHVAASPLLVVLVPVVAARKAAARDADVALGPLSAPASALPAPSSPPAPPAAGVGGQMTGRHLTMAAATRAWSSSTSRAGCAWPTCEAAATSSRTLAAHAWHLPSSLPSVSTSASSSYRPPSRRLCLRASSRRRLRLERSDRCELAELRDVCDPP